MDIVVRNKSLRWFLALLTVAVFLFVVGWITRIYFASFYASRMTAQGLTRAVRLDPGNSAYHLQLGGLYEYTPASMDPEKATAEFRRAAELAPYDPAVWINLGGAAEFAGDVAEAEQYLRQADYLAPRIPLYQWRIGNFYLLHGNNQQAFAHFKMVLGGTREYDQAVFRTAWKASGDTGEILNQLVPENLPAEFSYLHFLVTNKQFSATHEVWKRILATPGKFQPMQASGYIESLIRNHLPADAFGVWQDLGKKGLLPFSGSKEKQDMITNGNFESDILNIGFGWRIIPMEGMFAGPDTSNYHSPGHSLLVQFPGNQNLFYRHVIQFVKVEPAKTYRLQAFIKTEGITTDSGPRMEVRDAYDPAGLDQFSESLTGSTQGWTSVILDFKTGPKTELVIVGLARFPSQKLDNQIAGRAWLDDVSLIPLN